MTETKTATEIAHELEIANKSRGLKFTSVFEGYVPVQAYGHVDGMQFYYRNRSGNASLRVGVYDAKIEQNKAEKHNKALDKVFGYPASATVTNLPSDKEFYPTVAITSAAIYMQSVSTQESFQLLLDTLEKVPTE